MRLLGLIKRRRKPTAEEVEKRRLIAEAARRIDAMQNVLRATD